MVLSKKVISNVAWFRIRGHKFKCGTGLHGRSPDRVHVFAVCIKTGISKTRTDYFFLHVVHVY